MALTRGMECRSDGADPPLSNKELVFRHYEDFIDRGDLIAADRDLRPDFVHDAAPPGTPRGPQSAKNWVEMVRAGFPDIQRERSR